MSHPSLRLLRNQRAPVRRLLSQTRPIVPATNFSSIRPASTAEADASTRLKNFFYGASLTFFIAFGYLYITDTRAGAHQWLVVPAIRLLYPDAEDAHHI